MLCLLLSPIGAPLHATDTEQVQIQRALDGDSLLLADRRQVRLIGINSPEFGKDGKPDDPLARAARDRADALTRGQTIRLSFDTERLDRYGRILAYALLPDGRELQEVLLREGLAWFIAIPPNIARLAAHRAAENEARAARRGIWEHPEYQPLPADQIPPGRSGFVLLAGTVTAMRTRGDVIELQLAPRVQLQAPRDVLASLAPAPRTLRGKRVLARGWLTEYKNGLRLRVTHPAMLEVQP